MPQEVDVTDLDLADRAQWTGEQWQRAEAAGLIVIAPEPEVEEPASEPQLTQLKSPKEDVGHVPLDPWEHEDPVWWDGYRDDWQTRFPKPVGWSGREWKTFGDRDYARDLTPEEHAIMEAAYPPEEPARPAKVTAAERDMWFAEHKAFVEAQEKEAEMAEKTLGRTDIQNSRTDGPDSLRHPDESQDPFCAPDLMEDRTDGLIQDDGEGRPPVSDS
ncbi:hypothetical protein [Sphingomonas sp. ID0503]|uniref:hypothetical protein n=1 Tax=Sphingomonas sp. ID0503 TaxID=3399691 RepID=UPI003AFB2495